MTNDEELITIMKYFGLEDDDAKIYIGLLRIGSITVGNLSQKLEIERGKTYRSLNKLKNSGMVITTMSNPATCEAVAPSEALKGIIQKKDDEIVIMKKLSQQAVEKLEAVTRSITPTKNSSFAIIQGRTNIYTRIGKVIEESESLVYIVSTKEDLMRMYHTSIPEKIQDALKRKVEVKIITEVDDKQSWQLINRLGVSEIRIGKLPSKGRMIVEKDKQIVMSGSMMKETMDFTDEADSIMHTNSTEIVNNIFSLCSHLWKSSKPIEAKTMKIER